MLLALLYTTRLRPILPHINAWTAFTAALLMAQKWLKDESPRNEYWAQLAGINVSLLNNIELSLLVHKGLWVGVQEWERWKAVVKVFFSQMKSL